MKTILFVLDYYLPHRGGIENVFENIILRLEKKGYKIIVLTSRYNKLLEKYEKIGNVEIYRTGKSRLGFMRSAVKLGKKIFSSHQIDVIHASTYGGAIPASILGKKFETKVILTVHEVFGKLRFQYKGKFLGGIYKFFESILFKFKYGLFHCVSQNTAKDLQKYYGISSEQINVIYNGIDDDFWSPHQVSSKEIFEWRKKYNWDDKFVFLYFGHAGKSKGLDYLIQALPELLSLKNIVMVFNIIESKRTKKILETLKKIDNPKLQIFDGFSKDDLRRLVASSDCVIAPSISEGFGSVHTESVAMGKILITTKTSAIPEVVWGKVKFIKTADSNAIFQACQEVLDGEVDVIEKKYFDRNDSVEKIEKLYFS